MQAEGVDWGEDYRASARQARAEPLEGRRGQLIDQHLERMAELGEADRRNGCYRRHLLTELGDLELAVPCTRTFSALKVVRAYARRAHNVDRMILACFVLGLSTRKVATALLPVFGRPGSPATVSQVAKQLDAAVAAFHRRPLKDPIPGTGAGRRGARAQDRRRRSPDPSWSPRPTSGRQEGSHRLSSGHRRERSPVGALPRRSGASWRSPSRARNRAIGVLRAPVERTFGVLKRRYGCGRVRYRSLVRNALQLQLLCVTLNLRRALMLSG
jgi:hypothetical protein